MRNDKMIQRTLIVLGLILLGILLIPIIIYSINFHDHYISMDSTDWGTFGDFIGGITNPIIGIVNVLVLIYLTLKISEIEKINRGIDKTNRENENHDGIRLEGFKELNSFFMRLVKRVANEDPIENKERISLKFEFDGIIHPYIDLFKVFDNLERINKLSNSLLKIPEYRTESESLDIISKFSELLSELRIEIRTITTVNSDK